MIRYTLRSSAPDPPKNPQPGRQRRLESGELWRLGLAVCPLCRLKIFGTGGASYRGGRVVSRGRRRVAAGVSTEQRITERDGVGREEPGPPDIFDLLLNTKKLSSPLQGMGCIPSGQYCPMGPAHNLAANWLQKLVKVDTSSRVHGVTRDTSPRRRSCLSTSRAVRKPLAQDVEVFPGCRILW